jgi:hypothetical protein
MAAAKCGRKSARIMQKIMARVARNVSIFFGWFVVLGN